MAYATTGTSGNDTLNQSGVFEVSHEKQKF
jgi:hypothetical protein